MCGVQLLEECILYLATVTFRYLVDDSAFRGTKLLNQKLMLLAEPFICIVIQGELP